MDIQLISSIVCFILFVYILANSKISNSLVVFLLAPLAVFTGVLEVSDIQDVLTNNLIMLIIVIGIFTHLMSISTLDMSIGHVVDKFTGGETNKEKQETKVLAILMIISIIASMFMQNLSVAMATLPSIVGISRVTKISRSKMVLFVIFASTLGGAITLIGTPTNVFANAALEEFGIEGFKFFDFAWVALPIAIAGTLYMLAFHRFAPSYDDWEDDITLETVKVTEETSRQKTQKKWTGISFILFVIFMILNGFFPEITRYLNPYMVAFFAFALMFILRIFDIRDYVKGFPSDGVLTMWGILVIIRIVSQSGLGEVFGSFATNIIGDSQNLYFITAILFIGSAIVTSFMNNMATAGVLAPIGISIANSMGADPRAIVLTIAVGAGCSYLTPMGSGTNQGLVPFTRLKFQDFTKFGWPLVIISFLFCLIILPMVFPFF